MGSLTAGRNAEASCSLKREELLDLIEPRTESSSEEEGL
jgi:hypothetical protein